MTALLNHGGASLLYPLLGRREEICREMGTKFRTQGRVAVSQASGCGDDMVFDNVGKYGRHGYQTCIAKFCWSPVEEPANHLGLEFIAARRG